LRRARGRRQRADARTTAQNFMYQLCIGIAHLHRHGVMHRRERRAVPRQARR
jgi:hypothetical protein